MYVDDKRGCLRKPQLRASGWLASDATAFSTTASVETPGGGEDGKDEGKIGEGIYLLGIWNLHALNVLAIISTARRTKPPWQER